MQNLKHEENEDLHLFLAANRQVLSRLLTFIDFAAGLTIGFIEIDREQERDWIVDWLIDSPQCQDIQFLVLTYESPDLRFLLDEILKSLPQDLPTDKNTVLIIKGLEYSIGHTEYPPVLQNLNFVRDAFIDTLPYPILFCLPSYQITSFANYAPDFWAWKSGLFKFESVELEPIFSPSLSVEYFQTQRTPEPQSRLDLLLKLLVEHKADPNNINLSTVVSILQQLGSSHRSRQEWREAEIYLTEALNIIAKNPSLSISKTNLWIELADIYREQNKYHLAEELCQKVLSIDRDILSPQQWAETINILGLIYAINPQGNIAENLENAIACFQSILTVYTSDDFPQAWALTQNNLGNAYRKRIRGDRAENLELAIKCFQVALRVYTKTDFPQDWAQTQNNLGNAYRKSILENRVENLEQAIEYYQAALEVRTKTALPQAWALTQNNLASAYLYRIRGDRAENLERAIEYYQAALRVNTEIAFPQAWAHTQYKLGNAYLYRIRGDRAENLERAIEYYQAALRVNTEIAFPQYWAHTQYKLGNAYQLRIRGDRSENLEMAIESHQAALRVRNETDFPQYWAQTQNNLGLAYTQRIKGEKAENIKMAIECYQNALKVYTPDTFPREWEQAQNLLQAISPDSIPSHP